MKSKIIFGIVTMAFLFLAGCTGPTKAKEEPVLLKFQDIGVLLFDTPEDSVITGEVFPVVLHIRNNALGQEAENITVSLDNVKPFLLLDCEGTPVDSNEIRGMNSKCIKGGANSLDPQLNLDPYLTYREYGMRSIDSDLEKTFYWVLQAPNDTEVGKVFNHVLYYNIKYTYKIENSLNVVYVSQDEKTELESQGVEIPVSEVFTTAGAISLESLTDPQLKFYVSTNINPVQYIGFKLKNDGYGFAGDTTLKFTYDPKVLSVSLSQLQGGWSCDVLLGKCTKTLSALEMTTETGTQRIPVTLTNEERQRLIDGNIPISTYTTIIEVQYPYTLSGYVSVNIKSPYI